MDKIAQLWRRAQDIKIFKAISIAHVVILLVGFAGGTVIIPSRTKAITFTVTNTSDLGPGSLRNTIEEANINCAGTTKIEFNIPDTDPGKISYSSGSYFRILTLSPLPPILCDGLEIDGLTQSTFGGDTNPGDAGAGGSTGVDVIPFAKIPKPEIEIRSNFTAPTTKSYGIESNAKNVKIKNLSILGFGSPNQSGDIGFLGSNGGEVSNSFIGISPEGITEPEESIRGKANGIYIENNPGVKIDRNIIAYHGMMGIFIFSGDQSNHQITNNEIRSNNREQGFKGPGIGITEGSTAENGVIQNNLIVGHDVSSGPSASNDYADFGIEITSPVNGSDTSGFLIDNNTLSANATAVVLAGGTHNKFQKNLVYNNIGKGMIIQGKKNTISKNSFYSNDAQTNTNAGLAIDINGDGVTYNDLNDTDLAGNDSYNFPVFESAEVDATSLTIKGFARPNAKIEFFIAENDPTGFGEGKTYLTTKEEGSNIDLNTGTGTYDSFVSGLFVGTDTSPRFTFVIPLASLPAAIPVGTNITSTATDLEGNTSEFSGNISVTLAAKPNSVISMDDFGTTTVNTPINISVFGNDLDPEGDLFELNAPLSIINTLHGSATCVASGVCTYTPANNYTGTDTFEYTIIDSKSATSTSNVYITISSAAVNENSVKANPDSSTTTVSTPVVINVFTNDVDPQGDTFTLTGPIVGTSTPNGQVICTPQGSCTYTPKTGFTGADTFQYTITDSKGATSTTTVTITITNPAPSGGGSGGGGGGVLLCILDNTCKTNPPSLPSPTVLGVSSSLKTAEIRGSVFFDSNNNGIKDQGEKPVTGAKIMINNDESNLLITDTEGLYSSIESEGPITITLLKDQSSLSNYEVSTNFTGGSIKQSFTLTSGNVHIAEDIGLYKDNKARALLYDTTSEGGLENIFGALALLLGSVLLFTRRYIFA